MDSAMIGLFNITHDAFLVDENLNTIKHVDSDKQWVYYSNFNGYRFLSQKNKTLVINLANRAIAEIAATSKAFLHNWKLYDYQDNRLVEIDLETLLPSLK